MLKVSTSFSIANNNNNKTQNSMAFAKFIVGLSITIFPSVPNFTEKEHNLRYKKIKKDMTSDMPSDMTSDITSDN